MSRAVVIALGLLLAFLFSCKTNRTSISVASTTPTEVAADDPNAGVPALGMAINIGGMQWQAETYSVIKMGTFWIVKGTAADASVVSIMLPDPLTNKHYAVVQGGDVSVTYSTSRAKGFLFLAPYADNNGWVKTTLDNGHLRGNLEVTVSNGGNPMKCAGMFNIKL